MVFFLSARDHKYMLNHLLRLAREVGVSQDLRGWNWWKEPLKPYYSERISMFSVCGKFCPTSRDVYLQYVERKAPSMTWEFVLGASAHNLLEHIFTELRAQRQPTFREWWASELEHKGRNLRRILNPSFSLFGSLS